MSERKKTAYHHGDLRRALLDAAVSLVEEHGVDGCTLREAARRAGVSHAAPYRHFEDREALVSCVAAEGFVILQRRIASRSRRARGSTAKLRAWGAVYVAFALERPALFQLMFGRRLDPTRHPEAASAADRLFGDLATLIEACRDEGSLAAGTDPGQAARIGWAMMHGVAQLALAGQLEASARHEILTLASGALDVLLAGLR